MPAYATRTKRQHRARPRGPVRWNSRPRHRPAKLGQSLSLHPNGKRYVWELSSGPQQLPVAKAPENILRAVGRRVRDHSAARERVEHELDARSFMLGNVKTLAGFVARSESRLRCCNVRFRCAFSYSNFGHQRRPHSPPQPASSRAAPPPPAPFGLPISFTSRR